MPLSEAEIWWAMRSPGPYDRTARERIAEALFALFGDRVPLGSLTRSHLILQILLSGFPTPSLSAAYFDNLERLLAAKERLPAPGHVVLGLGAGRCGSTSLTAMLAAIERSCCTHENPPGICWNPLDEQVSFQMKRFERLAQFFPLVFDASHWWINALDKFFSAFPDGRAIGLCREVEACVASFMKIKGSGRGSLNHWVPPANGIWRLDDWDSFYPTYPVPNNAAIDPDGAKAAVIRRYVQDYNKSLEVVAERFAGKVMLIRTEELGQITVQQRIFDFVGLRGNAPSARLNIGRISDGVNFAYRF